jgi:class 3 adenylate cyclase
VPIASPYGKADALCKMRHRESARQKILWRVRQPFFAALSTMRQRERPTFKFCGECGAALDDIVRTPNAAAPVAASGAGERRHLTVLFCDLVGSTEIAAQLDPEEWRELLAGYHRAAAEAITRHGGYVAKYVGDGVMAYFGWPEAHENYAERAARAGLAILEAVPTLNQESAIPTISVRIGIDSGTVVVGAGAGKDADVFGETPNVAARVQTAAAPDTVLITGATHRLLSLACFWLKSTGPNNSRASPTQSSSIESCV